MRITAWLVVLVLVLAMSSPASADRSGSGGSFELGYARNRVAVTDRTTLDGELVRFGLRLFLGGHLHVGVEAEEGRIAGTTSLPDGAVARTTEQSQDPLDGNTLGLKALAGVHANAGAFSFGSDVATGMRDTWVSSTLGMDVAGRKNELLLELRGRVDVWLTSAITLGAVASTDVLERRNVSLGAVLALQLTR